MQFHSYSCPYLGIKIGALKSPALFQGKELQVTRFKSMCFCAWGEGGGTPIWNRQGCSLEILNLTPKGDHLGVAQVFCDL